MADTNTISKSEKVLLAAYSKWLENEFTAEELVVACWEKYPDSFGLQGYSDKYPDANVVYRHIMGKNSIVKKQRWLSQKGQKRYAITPAGINHALKILGLDGLKADMHHRIDRYYEQVLLRVLTGSAWTKFKGNLIDAITFTEACDVWSISPRSSGEQYKAARRDLALAISTVKRNLGEGHSEITLLSKISVSSKDIDDIEILEQALNAKFKDQLDLISRRSVRWGKVSES